MDALFNSLKRGTKYTFVFGSEVPAIVGVFHEIRPDGSLLVAGSHSRAASPKTHVINPEKVVYVREGH